MDLSGFIIGAIVGAGAYYLYSKSQGETSSKEKSNNDDQLLSLKRELKGLKDEYESLKQKRVQAEDALNQAEQELRDYKHSSKKENRVERDLQEDIEGLKRTNSDLIDENRSLSAKNEELTILLNQSRNERNSLEDRIKDLEKK